MAEIIAGQQERPKSPLCRLVQAFSHILLIGVTVAFLTAFTLQAFAQAPPAQTASVRHSLLVTVHDENDVVVSSARLLLSPTGSKTGIAGETDYAGRHEFDGLAAGAYRLEVQKEGFYAITQEGVKVGETSSVEVTLNHLKEYKETVQVVSSPQAIDPARIADSETLNSQEIIDLPYPTTRDIRNAFPLLPGVLPDNNGQVHINGAASNQVFYTLDGFDVTAPVSGLNGLRVSTDAVRSIDVLGSRYSTAYGKGSGGVLNLDTGMGDDHFRLTATDFIPDFQEARGLHLKNVTPRITFSGPIERGKAWFFEAADGEYDQNIFKELPSGEDTDHFWRMGNLLRGQVNVTPANRLISSFLINRSHEDHAGLSLVQPLSTTTEQAGTVYLVTVKDQAYWANGMLLEVGFGFNQYNTDERPRGTLPYAQFPGTASGNFYLTSNGESRRFQGIANLFLPTIEWHGRHQFEVGTDLDRINYNQFATRRPFSICSGTPPPSGPSPACITPTVKGTLERSVSFMGNPTFARNNFAASWFVQDRWSVTDRLLIEPGLRLDTDEIIRRALVSPRFAFTYLLTADGQTKLSAGIGLYYDRTDLNLVTRPLAGQRRDTFYAPDGMTPLGPPVATTFVVNQSTLEEPRFLNWSAGLERKLPAAVYLRVDYLQKRGVHGFDYENVPPSGGTSLPSGLFALHNNRRDHYDAVTFTLRRTFKDRYPVLASYTRSSARSNAVLDSTLDNPLFSPQLGGRLAWDSPNRILSWGFLPLIKGFDFAYSLDWRTGYPFSVINKNQELVGLPDRMRFPDFFALNVHIEKRFGLFGFQWALRAGFNNVTSRDDPSVVDNNVDSPTFGRFGAFQHRAFTGRIRFLGRK